MTHDPVRHIATLICASQQVDPDSPIKGPTGMTIPLRHRIEEEVHATFREVVSKTDLAMLKAAAIACADLPQPINVKSARDFRAELNAFVQKMAVYAGG